MLPGRSASASPAELIFGGFKSPSSATGAILSPLEVIVNVFSIFYLFQTICAIQYFQITVQLFSALTFFIGSRPEVGRDVLEIVF